MAIMMRILIATFLVFASADCFYKPDITVALILNDRDFRLDETYLKPPVDIALSKVDELIETGVYVNFSLSYIFEVTTNTCSEAGKNNAAGRSAELYFNRKIVAFLGPPCNIHTVSTADLAAFWNVPVIVGAGTSGNLEDKTRFPRFRSVAIAKFFRKIFRHFRWTRCAVMVARGGFHFVITAPDMLKVFQATNINSVTFYEKDFQSSEKMLDQASQQARSKWSTLKHVQVKVYST
ncbi:Receptor-type guanylate cyclase gcy-8 [Holothuria leucospilota]|uniref:Receptor-type guanylate cyclase gcy-8 n=1 Tax=Holothuria leucospilota TaxID=206669 RepID=A0A9Q1C1C7_HOLLE|nr:Receptor-type guanylate cyclase gcy-8 [Holothuria leucospilota]